MLIKKQKIWIYYQKLKVYFLYFKKVLKNNQEKIEQELREKYNPDKIFDRPEEKVEESQKLETDEPEINQGVSENEALTEYHESFMKNLINKIKEFIKNLFNKN